MILSQKKNTINLYKFSKVSYVHIRTISSLTSMTFHYSHSSYNTSAVSPKITVFTFKRHYSFFNPDVYLNIYSFYEDYNVYLNFYKMLHPDYYTTYIYPLLTESVEEKILRTSLEKYHLIHQQNLSHELYFLCHQNKIIIYAYLGFSLFNIALTSLNQWSGLTQVIFCMDPVSLFTMPIIGVLLIASTKYLVLEEELYEYLLESIYVYPNAAFILNQLDPYF